MTGSACFWSRATVASVSPLTRRFRRVELEGVELGAYAPVLPGDAMRLFLPQNDAAGFDYPWTDLDGSPYWPEGLCRPAMRTFAVRHVDPGAGRVVFDFALRDRPSRIEGLRVGAEVGFSGMRHGYVAQADAARHLFVGDRTALPAVAAILDALPRTTPVTAVLAVDDLQERNLLEPRPGLFVRWVADAAPAGDGSPLERAIRTLPAYRGRVQARVAGEAAVVRAVRRYLVSERGVRLCDVQAVVHWQAGRTSDERDEAVLAGFRAAARQGRDIADPEVAEAIELAAL